MTNDDVILRHTLVFDKEFDSLIEQCKFSLEYVVTSHKFRNPTLQLWRRRSRREEEEEERRENQCLARFAHLVSSASRPLLLLPSSSHSSLPWSSSIQLSFSPSVDRNNRCIWKNRSSPNSTAPKRKQLSCANKRRRNCLLHFSEMVTLSKYATPEWELKTHRTVALFTGRIGISSLKERGEREREPPFA